MARHGSDFRRLNGSDCRRLIEGRTFHLILYYLMEEKMLDLRKWRFVNGGDFRRLNGGDCRRLYGFLLLLVLSFLGTPVNWAADTAATAVAQM